MHRGVTLTTSSNSSDSKLREYGLEFIKDLAKDRKLAIQALGVSFSGFKTDLLNRSNIITRHEDRLQVESYLKSLDEDVNRTIESQLTRITIKSFNWIKNVMIQDERIVIENKDELLYEELQERLKRQEIDLSRLKHTNQSLTEQLEKKKKEFLESEQKLTDYQNGVQEQIVTENIGDTQEDDPTTRILEEISNSTSRKQCNFIFMRDIKKNPTLTDDQKAICVAAHKSKLDSFPPEAKKGKEQAQMTY